MNIVLYIEIVTGPLLTLKEFWNSFGNFFKGGCMNSVANIYCNAEEFSHTS